MEKRVVSGLILTLLLVGMLTLAFNIQPAKAKPRTIIVPDEFPTIQAAVNNANEGDTIYVKAGTYYEHVVVNKAISLIGENRETTIIDGSQWWNVVTVASHNVDIVGFTIQRSGAGYARVGIVLWGSANHANIAENNIVNNFYGICLYWSSNNRISGNNIADNSVGIKVTSYSSNNTISGNIMTNNYHNIWIYFSSHNSINGNHIVANRKQGIWLGWSSNNTISRNNIAYNKIGVWLDVSSNNIFYHNDFINNTQQVYDISWEYPEYSASINGWDDGHPSGGNYWSDYAGVDSNKDGIGDTPYVTDENNQDRYPLMEPWYPRTIDELKTKIEELGFEGEIDNQGIVKGLTAKLNVAQKLVDKGSVDEVEMVLEGFIMQVQELSGIHITVEAADLLIKSAESIVSQL